MAERCLCSAPVRPLLCCRLPKRARFFECVHPRRPAERGGRQRHLCSRALFSGRPRRMFPPSRLSETFFPHGHGILPYGNKKFQRVARGETFSAAGQNFSRGEARTTMSSPLPTSSANCGCERCKTSKASSSSTASPVSEMEIPRSRARHGRVVRDRGAVDLGAQQLLRGPVLARAQHRAHLRGGRPAHGEADRS